MNTKHHPMGAAYESRIAELEGRVDELKRALRLIVSDATPKYTTMRDQLVRTGIAMSGAIKHYEVMPHLIHRAKELVANQSQSRNSEG